MIHELRTEALHDAATDARAEAGRAMALYAPFNSLHEGFAVLLEEVDELWDEIKKKPAARDIDKIHTEATQIAAMALRLIVDCCDRRSRKGTL